MSERDQDRRRDSGRARPASATPRHSASPVLALQRILGNRATARVVARQAGSGRGTFANSVRIGKLGPIEVTESNIADWIGHKADAADLIVTTVSGKHSDECKRMSNSKARIDSVELQTISGENSWITVTFRDAVIRDYALDPSGKTERWKATDFDGVDIKRTSIGIPRP